VIQEAIGRKGKDGRPYFDYVDMVGPRDETIVPNALTGRYTVDQLIAKARKAYERKPR
jgi:hypothetical protein